ncbi:MAG: glutamate--tRNA ligase [Firmicutes bacterium]|nr:glutamate--tRNA ligase [Bacillota bacterium]
MDYDKLAELLFPNITKTPEDYEALYPERSLPEGAMVTRMAPSPTGFIHLGNLYGALADERLAHTTGGACFLRIEDTDDKREVEGAVPVLLDTLSYFGITFDEGKTKDGEIGAYGPYTQSQRAEIYQTMVKHLVRQGKAYPCFMTEEEIEEIRKAQAEAKLDPGIYGAYAKHRDLSYEEIEKRIQNGEEYVIRFRSEGDPARYFHAVDAIRGDISMPENVQDVVILKKIGLPTYHFAHVVDDHLMRTTHVVRGEEWMASVPIHVQLFDAMGWERPIFCHNTVLMKIDEETNQKRKLSKRKDPELSLEYYKKLGYFPEAVREYLMTILNSDYEEWRLANPEADYRDFDFSASKMSSSGTLFDLSKLNDVSKDVLAKKSAAQILEFMLSWAEEYHRDIFDLFSANKEKLLKIFDIDRGGEKPRKDLIFAEQIFGFMKYFFDEYFEYQDEWPAEVSAQDRKEILTRYLQGYDPADDNSAWFEKVRAITADLGYAVKPKDYKKNPEQYKGHVGHVSTVIRRAVTGKTNSPDLWTVQQIMGIDMVRSRVEKAMEQ